MKAVVVLCALVVVVSARPDEKYTDKWDNTDIDPFLENDRLLNSYVACVRGEGRCTPEGKELASHIPDALETGCTKCTDKQKESSRYIIKFLINNKPDIWKKLGEKFDPNGKYTAQYEKELKELK